MKREKLARHPRTIWQMWACDIMPTSRIIICYWKKEYVELTRLKTKSHDPIFFTGTQARSRFSGNDRLLPRVPEFGAGPEILDPSPEFRLVLHLVNRWKKLTCLLVILSNQERMSKKNHEVYFISVQQKDPSKNWCQLRWSDGHQKVNWLLVEPSPKDCNGTGENRRRLSRHGRVQWTQHSQLPRFGAVGLKSLNAARQTYIGLSLRASLFKIFKKRATVLRQMTNKLHIIRTRRMAMCTLISDVSENVEWKYGCSLQRNSFSRMDRLGSGPRCFAYSLTKWGRGTSL